MAGLETDTVGGFNGMIAKQKQQEGEAFVTTVLFDNEIETLHDRIPLTEVPEMTEKEYFVRGCTALIDAIGTSIRHVETIHKYARKEDVPAHTLFVITTDGLENASRKYSSAEVKKMIERKKEKDGWEFLFIGANIDAVETARHMGISADRAVNYHADQRGTKVVFDAVCAPISAMRRNRAIDADWGDAINEDYESRK